MKVEIASATTSGDSLTRAGMTRVNPFKRADQISSVEESKEILDRNATISKGCKDRKEGW
ncbi:hypothetical protein PA598K_04156 [Paenibacillus sp. 598K]|nr:hypothetical protein PA598K_04156 [Paenibacillus sp. 598K]